MFVAHYYKHFMFGIYNFKVTKFLLHTYARVLFLIEIVELYLFVTKTDNMLLYKIYISFLFCVSVLNYYDYFYILKIQILYEWR